MSETLVPAVPPPRPSVRPLGRTGIDVTTLGLGGAPLGGRLGTVPATRVAAVLEAFFEHGLNLIDTAARYGAGLAERELGNCLSGRARTAFVICTKVSVPAGTAHRGRAMEDQITRSLERLRCGHLDIALVHDPEDLTADELAEDLAALAGLREAGVLRAIGVGVDDVGILTGAVESGAVDCVLISGRYTLLDQSAAGDLLPLCEERGVGVLLGSMLHSGILATGLTPGARFNYSARIPEAVSERVALLSEACRQHRVELGHAAIQFGLTHPAVASVLVGTRTPEHLGRAAADAVRPVPDAFWSAVGLAPVHVSADAGGGA